MAHYCIVHRDWRCEQEQAPVQEVASLIREPSGAREMVGGFIRHFNDWR